MLLEPARGDARARRRNRLLRRERLDEEAADVAQERGVTQEALARARAELDRGLLMLGELDSRRHELEDEREERREAVAAARARAQAAQVGGARPADPHRVAPLDRELR